MREMKYQDYIFEEEQILKSINRLTEEREKLLRDVRETFMLKKPIIEGLQGKHEQLTREITVARLKIEDLRRVGEEMKISNSNLQK